MWEKRELTLEEWVARLDEHHLARRQYAEIKARMLSLEAVLGEVRDYLGAMRFNSSTEERLRVQISSVMPGPARPVPSAHPGEAEGCSNPGCLGGHVLEDGGREVPTGVEDPTYADICDVYVDKPCPICRNEMVQATLRGPMD